MVKVELGLQPGTANRFRSVFAAIPELSIHEGLDFWVAVGTDRRPMKILPRPPVADDSSTAPERLVDTSARHLANDVPDGTVGLVVSRSIPIRHRESLERFGLSWCDGRGAFHLEWPGVLVHIDHSGRRRVGLDPTAVNGPRLGPAGLRAVQVLLSGNSDEWTTNLLAQRASVSVGQAHNVFHVMEEMRFVVSIGRGPKQRRLVTDRGAALDWLAEIDGARRRPQIARAYLYGRTENQIIVRFAERAAAEHVPYALTGAAGSTMLEVPLMSRATTTQIRVGGAHFGESIDRLGLERADESTSSAGMNLELWSDTGQLGTFGSTIIGGIHVAPPIRIWLDLRRQGGRSLDAADMFREQVVDRA